MSVQSFPRSHLETLVDTFDRDTAAGRDQIRSLMEREPQMFQEGIVPVLRSCTSSRGIQFVVDLLVRSPHLFRVLCDPALTLTEATMLARTAVQVDRSVDVALAKRLADEALGPVSSAAARRMLEILSEISDGGRLMPSLLRLMRLDDAQLRLKAVQIVRRASHSVKWVRSRLADSDPRAGANAIETMWGNDSAEARDLLRIAAVHGNNRVAANALYGLYAVGETSALTELIRMGSSEAPLFRASAAWAMGETGDWRFAAILGRLICDGNAIVRKRAFNALGQIRNTAAKARTRPQWRVVARTLPPVGETRQLLLEAAPRDGGALPKLVPTQFQLSEGKQPILVYQVEERMPPEALAITLLLPRLDDPGGMDAKAGAANCLKWARPADLWRVAQFAPVGAPGEAGPPVELQYFSPYGKTAAAALERPLSPAQCPGLWHAMLECLRPAAQPARAARRLIVCCPADPGAVQPQELIDAAINGQFSVHAIAARPNPALEEICQRTRGSMEIAATAGDFETRLEDAYQLLLARFLISYQAPESAADALYIWLSNGSGWGELTVCLQSGRVSATPHQAPTHSAPKTSSN